MEKEKFKAVEVEVLSPEEFGDEYGRPFEDAEEKSEANAQKVSNGFWQKVAVASDKIPQIEQIVAAYYCAFDPQTSNKVRATLLACLAYFILPLDAIPDFLAGFGFTDDIAVITAAITSVKTAIKDRHVDAAKRKLAEAKEISQK